MEGPLARTSEEGWGDMATRFGDMKGEVLTPESCEKKLLPRPKMEVKR